MLLEAPVSRDYVALYPNLRVDTPDLDALQRNARSEVRSAMASLMFGENVTTLDLRRVISGFQCTDNADATITIQDGTATGAELLVDGSREYGVVFGRDGDASQILDFTGLGAATYGIYVRFAVDPGEAGNRVFWDSGVGEEVIQTVATRQVVRWQPQIAASSPGTEWVLIATVVWNGVSVGAGDITHSRRMFFEGNEGSSFADEWGDGANDRAADRGQHGVQSLYTFVHMVRRQLNEIINSALPQSGHVAVPAISLAETKTHVDDTSDPHGTTLTQTNIVLNSGYIRNLTDTELQDAVGNPVLANFFVSPGELAACRMGRTNTEYINIPGQALLPPGGVSGPTLTAGIDAVANGIFFDNSDFAGSGIWLRYRIDVPADCYFTFFEVVATGVAAGSTYTATLYRQGMDSGNHQAMSILTGTGSGDITQTDTVIAVPQVLDDHGYYVEIEVPLATAADDLTIHGIRVGYVRGNAREETASDLDSWLSPDMPSGSNDYAWVALLQGTANKRAATVINLSDRIRGARGAESCEISRITVYYYNASGTAVDIRAELVQIDRTDGKVRSNAAAATIATTGADGVSSATIMANTALDTVSYWYELEIAIVDKGTPVNDNFGVYGVWVQYEKSRVW